VSKYKLTRRDFLKFSGASLFLAGLPIPGYTKDKPPGNISVILLEGGMDGLTAVPPYGDPNLMKMREKISPTNFKKVNSFFGLHSSLRNFASLMSSNNASVIHATSFPYVKRSHFEGQNLMQGAGHSPFSEKTGWLGRALDLANVPGNALSLDMPLILRGNDDNDNFYPANIKNSSVNTSLINLISKAHDNDEAEIFSKLSLKASNAYKVPRDPVSLAEYAGKEMSKENGPNASVIRIGQFDTHANQVGAHDEQLKIIDDVFAGYRRGLGDAWDKSIILTLTEFGRTVAVNGTRGTEHGYGTAGLLAGGTISKGRVIAQWPGLSKKDQFEGRDLMATLDYRSVCAACIERSLGLDHDLIASKVFFAPKLPRLYDYLFS
jgi:uncharacterized protein (DUF1501 family)